jgi:hypothetical protein
MTQDEMEAEINGLHQQVLQLQQQQDNQKKHWFRCGQICSVIILLGAIVDIHDRIVIGASSQEAIAVVTLSTFLLMAFGSLGRPPAGLSFWSYLTWGWSGMFQTRTSSSVL